MYEVRVMQNTLDIAILVFLFSMLKTKTLTQTKNRKIINR